MNFQLEKQFKSCTVMTSCQNSQNGSRLSWR